MVKERYKDTDLREALKRKYADTPQLPADFITKMQEETLTHSPTPTEHTLDGCWLAVSKSMAMKSLIIDITSL